MTGKKIDNKFYEASLRNGTLTEKYLEEIATVFKKPLKVTKLTDKEKDHFSVPKELSRLPLYFVAGNKSWEGLCVGFPGNTGDLATSNVGTPFLRKLLYPVLELFLEVRKQRFMGQANCVYFMGARFSDVFIRKFNLLASIVPNVILLTNDLVKTVARKDVYLEGIEQENKEAYYQQKLCNAMASEEGLYVPDGSRSYKVKYLSREVQTGEGTKKPERLDILGVDPADHSLVAFEIKGPSCGKLEFQNLFLQGLEHRNWLEKNKMAVKLIEEGPLGKKINTRKRVKLVLGFFCDTVPEIFNDLRRQQYRDNHMQISFVRITTDKGLVKLAEVG